MNKKDTESGGFADRPGDMADVYHTFFGLAGYALFPTTLSKHTVFECCCTNLPFLPFRRLSFLGEPGLAPIDPAFALGQSTVDRLGLTRASIASNEIAQKQ